MADDEEGVVDNWEDADTEELERRMEERQKQLQPKKVIKIKTRPASQDKQDTSSPSTSNCTGQSTPEPQTQLPLKIQDSDRTEYVAPIKILKRKPDSSPSTQPHHSTPQTSSPNTGTAPSSKQYKTLAEREAEYASARARILGTDYRSDDTASNSPSQRSPVAASKVVSASDNIRRQPRGPTGSKGFTNTGTP